MKKTNYEIGKEIADQIDANIIEVLQAEKSFRVEAGAGPGKHIHFTRLLNGLIRTRLLVIKKEGNKSHV